MAWQEAHDVAARFGTTTNQLAWWARRGWIERSVVGRLTYYDAASVERLIDSHADRRADPSTVTPFSEALAQARAGFGIGPTAATASRPTKKRRPV